MRWLDGITDLMDVSLSKLWELVLGSLILWRVALSHVAPLLAIFVAAFKSGLQREPPAVCSMKPMGCCGDRPGLRGE